MKSMFKSYAVTGLAVAFLVIVLSAVFYNVNKNAHAKDVAMTSNDIKSVVQPAPDSGLVMCQQMAERASTPGVKAPFNYGQVSVKFSNSKHADIKDAGMQLVGTLERVEKAMAKDDTPVSESMGAVMAMRIAWEDLQDACRNHGVDVPDLP